MAGPTVRVTVETHEALRELAQATGQPMQEVLAKAVEAYRRRRLLEMTNAAYSALQADPVEWQAVQEERAAWDATLVDGLERD